MGQKDAAGDGAVHLIVLCLAEKILALSWISGQIALAIAQVIQYQPKVLHAHYQVSRSWDRQCKTKGAPVRIGSESSYFITRMTEGMHMHASPKSGMLQAEPLKLTSHALPLHEQSEQRHSCICVFFHDMQACVADLWVSVDEKPSLSINRSVCQACSAEISCARYIRSLLCRIASHDNQTHPDMTR